MKDQDIPLHKWERIQLELDKVTKERDQHSVGLMEATDANLVLQRSQLDLCQERDQLKAEVERCNCVILQSTIDRQDMKREANEAACEVSRLSRQIAMLRMHPDLVRERCDAWHDMARDMKLFVERFKEPRFDAFETNEYILGSSDCKRAFEALARFNAMEKGTK